MSWDTSRRRDRLPNWWPVTVKRILARDPRCQCGGCERCAGGSHCVRPSTEVDHIVPGDDHRDVNLRGICTPCHALKSSWEGLQARRDRTALRSRPKPPERHPGEIRRPS